MSEPEFSDIDSDGFPNDVSGDEYSDNLMDSCDEQLEIDMDSSPVISSNKNKTKTSITSIKTVINKTAASNIAMTATTTAIKQPTKPIITTKKPIVKKAITSSIDSEKKVPKQPILEDKEKYTSKKGTNEVKKEASESAADSKFQFNEETIEYFCKDILGDVKKICVPNSSFNNDTALLCLLLKLQIVKEYKCVEKKCKTGKTWLGQPIQLLIHRKNGKMQDLSINNLELICANCYIAKYGLDLFVKVISKTIYTCTYCGYPLSNFTNNKKKERICMSCESKIMSSGYFEQRSKFIDQLSDTIDEASTLKKDEFKSSNYYSQVSQFKSFDSTDGVGFKSARKATSESSKKTFNDKPIIALNLTVPNIDDLISED
jgi:hypothetical protein